MDRHAPTRRLRTLAVRALFVAAALSLAACRDSSGVPATVLASARSEGLVLMDRTPYAVGFVAIGDASVPVVDWIPCACPRIAAGAQVVVPRDQIIGLQDSDGAATVFWWAVRPATGGGYEIVPGVSGTLRVRGL